MSGPRDDRTGGDPVLEYGNMVGTLMRKMRRVIKYMGNCRLSKRKDTSYSTDENMNPRKNSLHYGETNWDSLNKQNKYV